MQEIKLTSLQFGNVFIESNLTGADLKIYSPDRKWWSQGTKRWGELKVPLDEMPRDFTLERATELAKFVLLEAETELNQNYEGGYAAACTEFAEWLVNH